MEQGEVRLRLRKREFGIRRKLEAMWYVMTNMFSLVKKRIHYIVHVSVKSNQLIYLTIPIINGIYQNMCILLFIS